MPDMSIHHNSNEVFISMCTNQSLKISMNEFPIVLAFTTGRCGTTYLESGLRREFAGSRDWITHEYLRQNITNVGHYHRCYDAKSIDAMRNEQIDRFLSLCEERATLGAVVDTGWTMRSLIPLLAHLFPTRLRVLHIHRHPINVAASFATMGSYTVNVSKQWALDPFDKQAAFTEFQDRWGTMTPFEKCLYLWLEINHAALEFRDLMPSIPFLNVPSEALFSDPNFLSRVALFCGLKTEADRPFVKPEVKKNRLMQLSQETRPIREEWEFYRNHPEVLVLAEQMGYDMSMNEARELISRYKLPKGFGPWIRYKTGYWVHRQKVGNLLRRAGLRR
jgi:hypothetical protein